MKLPFFLLAIFLSCQLSAGDPVKTIFIDVAHGGSDPGYATKGITEKDLCLSFALKLRELAQEYPELEIILNREQDESLGLSERVDQIKASKADLMLSIHFGSNVDNQEGPGISYFYYEESPARDASIAILQKLEEALANYHPTARFQAGPFLVLDQAQVPAVLIELGNLSRPETRALWSQTDHQELMARALLESLNQ